MTCGHLFNGIGGFALSAHWMGWENVMHCEIDKFCNRVMKHHFPNSIQHEDIRTTDFTIYRGKLDLITGGFPCQPYSAAGKRKGKEDERHLWPEMLRAIREIQPRWIVPENVRGLTNWNGGLVFEEVCAEMEAEGYEVLPFLLPAAGVNAPHRRDRIFFVAHAIGTGAGNINREANNQGWAAGEDRTESLRQTYGQACPGGVDTTDSHGAAADSDDITRRTGTRWENGQKVGNYCKHPFANSNCDQRCEGGMYEERSGETTGHACSCDPRHGRTTWEDFPTQSPLCSRNDGIPTGLVPVSVPGRRGRRTLTDKQAMGRIRNESIKAAGNAIVPQVALMIFKSIQQYENLSA